FLDLPRMLPNRGFQVAHSLTCDRGCALISPDSDVRLQNLEIARKYIDTFAEDYRELRKRFYSFTLVTSRANGEQRLDRLYYYVGLKVLDSGITPEVDFGAYQIVYIFDSIAHSHAPLFNSTPIRTSISCKYSQQLSVLYNLIMTLQKQYCNTTLDLAKFIISRLEICDLPLHDEPKLKAAAPREDRLKVTLRYLRPLHKLYRIVLGDNGSFFTFGGRDGPVVTLRADGANKLPCVTTALLVLALNAPPLLPAKNAFVAAKNNLKQAYSNGSSPKIISNLKNLKNAALIAYHTEQINNCNYSTTLSRDFTSGTNIYSPLLLPSLVQNPEYVKYFYLKHHVNNLLIAVRGAEEFVADDANFDSLLQNSAAADILRLGAAITTAADNLTTFVGQLAAPSWVALVDKAAYKAAMEFFKKVADEFMYGRPARSEVEDSGTVTSVPIAMTHLLKEEVAPPSGATFALDLEGDILQSVDSAGASWVPAAASSPAIQVFKFASAEKFKESAHSIYKYLDSGRQAGAPAPTVYGIVYE
ncbi:MAG: hypothetical protein EBU46_18390, partial [Nitrosomonadaceae bacterium]|nr:hypothetical protein [Nitrosomonadaceae bacterium]